MEAKNSWSCTRCATNTPVDSAEIAQARAAQHVKIKHAGISTSVTYVTHGVRRYDQ